jgi:diguanylate cyclase (GGDEF)-like protein
MFIAVLQSRIEQKLLHLKLEKQAHSDSLTGLFNRMYYEQNYLRLRAKNHTKKLDFSVIMIDVNGLKPVNDEIGHAAGDSLIKCVSNILLDTLRESDIVARTGGDEFTVLMEETDSSQCAPLVERITSRSGQKTLTFDQTQILVSYSVGYASSDQDEPDSLYEIADERMYKEKERYYQQSGLKKRTI